MSVDRPPLPPGPGELPGQGVAETDPNTAGLPPTTHPPMAGPAELVREAIPLGRPVVAGAADLAAALPHAAPVQRMPMPMSRLRAGVELVLLLPAGILGATATYLIVRSSSPDDPRWLHIADGLGMGAGCVLGCGLILLVARHKPFTIGLTGKRLAANVGIGLLALLITYVVLAQVAMAAVILHPKLLAGPSAAQQAIEQAFPPLSLGAAALVTAFVAFWEEVVCRGFVLTRFQAILRRWWLTVPIASGAFGMLHVYEGPLAIALITTLALVMSGLFVWRKSLVPSITYHLVHNLLMFQLLRSVSSTWQ